VRVSQVWGGRTCSPIFVPEIDDEVLVGFISGDSDRPIITGRIYH
jgi:type VI secretion system secreted protein VgrG